MAQTTGRQVRLLTVREVAEQLHCSQRTVYRLISQGQLPAVDLGGNKARRPSLRVHPEVVTAFMTAALPAQRDVAS
ncbi:MAG TPA: helix-turn-helix domain-containing protein [Jiangellaceae bacterium]|nr:helix-turn-helix domain-containing protein [Jiangellaceae bacterium]